jgi:cardiolipin synthase
MPLLFLSTSDDPVSDVAEPLAWAFVIWGLGIYWWSAVLYAEQASAVLGGRRLEVDA